MGSYVELHLRTAYSLLEGASLPSELVDRAQRYGYDALAVTDRDGLYGAMEFAQLCRACEMRAITGADLTLRHGLIDAGSGPVPITLLVENGTGYANLCRLLTEAHRSSPRDAVTLDPEFLKGHLDGLIVLTGSRDAEIPRLVAAGRLRDADAALARWAALAPRDALFVELQRNLVLGDSRRVTELVTLARQRDLPVVATGEVLYHDRARHQLQDALTAVRHRTTLEASHRLRQPNSEFFLRTPDEAVARFADLPEAVANTRVIAERCAAFDLSDPKQLGYRFPDFAREAGEEALTADEALAAYCEARFPDRYPPDRTPEELSTKAHEQLVGELAVIRKHGLAGFFLIYRDLQHLAMKVATDVRGAGSIRDEAGLPPGRGRGSSVSSIVCYLVGLSHIDPVKNQLFFRRFLNEDLTSVPDIDLDFAREIREELIMRVYERYGHDHAALVCNYVTYHLRSAVRDLGKVLGLPPASIDKLAKLSEGGSADTVRLELERLPEFKGCAEGPMWESLAKLAGELDGFPRHIGQHVGGMIISSRPLIEVVPVQPGGMPGRFICQWDKDGCDDARFIKIDFLALGMLSLVEECLEMIWRHRGEKLNLGAIPFDDPEIYDSITLADTVGTFQIESRAQMQMLPRTRPRTLDDLAVQVAIVRPGPIVGGAVNPYIRRREEQREAKRLGRPYKARADHPLLDDVLADTLGVVLYQDQVLEVAIRLGGFSPGQADRFRRAMSRRRSHAAMAGFREAFLVGARERGVPEMTAQSIFEKLLGFSEFGFPKSHAYAFAVLAYQSTWMRLRYPAEYYAALLNNQPMGFYAPHVLAGDAKRHGVNFLRVALNQSEIACAPRDGYVLLGFTMVQGVSKDLAREIVNERELRGPYRSLSDLLRRTSVDSRIVERLIAVGALSELGLSRRELLWQLGLLRPETGGTHAVRPARAKRARQLALDLPVEQDMVTLRDMTEWERMLADYEILGLSPAHHPLGLLRSGLAPEIRTAAQLRRAPDGIAVQTAGMVVCRQRPGTAKGFVFLLLEDETGLTNVVVRPDLYEKRRSVVRSEPYVLVEGRLQITSGTLNLLADRVAPLGEVPGALMPRPIERHGHPGNPHDPREKPVEGAERMPLGVTRDFH